MPIPTRILLTGFMGSGKTTVGRLLARHLNRPFCDLDHEIERQTGLTVPNIFAQHGEPHFRALELQALTTLLGKTEVVIALGGGAIETPAVRELLASTPDSATIYLEAPFNVLYERCQAQALNPRHAARPNLADPTTARTRHENRAPHYEAASTHRIAVAGINARETLEAILSKLGVAGTEL